MRVLTVAILLLPAVAEAQSIQASKPIQPLSAQDKLGARMRSMVSPMTQFGVLAGSAINQWRGEPSEWGQGWGAYGTRVGSGEGIAFSYHGIAAISDIAFHLDPRYRRMPDGTVKARIWNAISQEFLAYRDSGGRMINISALSASYGSGFIANTWEPYDHSKASDAIIRGTLSVATHAGGNVAREFLPDIVRRFRHRDTAQADAAPSLQQ